METFVDFKNDFLSEVKKFLQLYHDGKLNCGETDEYLDELTMHPNCDIKITE